MIDKPLPPCLLFDLDDTLLVFSTAGDRCWESLCRRFAPRLLGVSSEALLAAINEVRTWYWSDLTRHRLGRMDMLNARREIVRMAFERLGQNDPLTAIELADAFTTEREGLVQPYPGATEMLVALQGRGIRMALITNGLASLQRPKLQRFNLERFFDPILIESEFGIGKPDHKGFLHALDCLGSSPSQAWMVGNDLVFDIRPAQELGLDTVWVDFAGLGLPESSSVKPTWSVRSVNELLDAPVQ
jgi:putative hydrolase of the HAD superfamily